MSQWHLQRQLVSWRLPGQILVWIHFPPWQSWARRHKGSTGEIRYSCRLFCPSKATAQTLVGKLPAKRDGATTVLYPASTKAATTFQDGLADRGFVCNETEYLRYHYSHGDGRPKRTCQGHGAVLEARQTPPVYVNVLQQGMLSII